MSSNFQRAQDTSAAGQATPSGRSYSYSRKRWNAFDAWQEHVRKSAATVGIAFSARQDRDLRRPIVAG
jgi:hypothetical protein